MDNSEHNGLVDAQFSKAVSIVQSLPKTGPIQTDYEEKLVMYRDAWAKHKNLPSQEAKLLYVETLLRVLRKYSDKTVARDLCRELESYGNVDTSFTHSFNSRYGRGSPGSSGSESAAEAVRTRQRNSRLMHNEEYIPGSEEEEDTTTDEDDNTDHERDKGEYSEDDHENTEVQPTRPQTTAAATTTTNTVQHPMVQPLDSSFRPPSSLSSQTLMRYRTPMAGSMMSITPNVPGGLGTSMLSNLVPGPSGGGGGIPTVQPMPPYTTPSAFGEDSITFSPPIIPSSAGSGSLSASTYVPGAPYPLPYPYSHQFPPSSTPSVQTTRSSHSKALTGGLNLIHDRNSLPYNTIPLPSQAQYIQQYDPQPSVTNGVNGSGGGGGPPTIERVLQNIQAHIAALSERVEMLETITNVREISNINGGLSGAAAGNVLGGRNSSLSSSSLLLPGSTHSSFLGVTSNHVWDPTQLGLWSNFVRPLSRIVDSLRSAMAFLIYVPIEETHHQAAQNRDPRYRSYPYSRRRYSSPSLSILLIIRRLILDISFVFCLLGLVRFVWRRTGLKRKVVYNLLGMLWRIIMGGERRERVMVDKGV
ncbi:hypothetical protein Clacol_010558 [Clathrus columnatus]|uniref:Uncharacterized protein n=1 Tax=Clathrus columnatus TaxID=1419009 RepID=A0AAV5ANL1_9AGAM|nr:hypothetical protein Clacol_010558 [Clathrus columnatus]